MKGAGNPDALGFPFNQYFPFFVLSLFALFTVIFGSFFPESLNSQYQGPLDSNNDEDIENNDKKSLPDHEMARYKTTNFSMRYTKLN